MTLTVRRVITGHDDNGRAKVIIDKVPKNVVQGRPAPTRRRSGPRRLAPDNDGDEDYPGPARPEGP